MKRLRPFLFAALAAALVALVAWTALPGIPGRLLFSEIVKQSGAPLSAADARLAPDLDFSLRGLSLALPGATLTAERLLLDPEIRHALAGRPAIHFDADGIALRGAHAIDGGESEARFLLPVGALRGRAEWRPAPSLRVDAAPLGGRLTVVALADPALERVAVTFAASGLALADLASGAPLLSHRILARVETLDGKVALPRGGRPEGSLRFGIGAGALLTLVATSPVSLEPTGFGEIPAQLGLTNDLSSRFASITGEATVAGDGGLRFAAGVVSDHYLLELSGAVDPARELDGRLVLHLPPATLARNAWGADFGGDTLRIYGHFRGPLDGEIVSVWDADKEALLRAAAGRVRERMRDWFRMPRLPTPR